MRIDSRLDQMSNVMVGREEYESDQEALRSGIESLTNALDEERKAREIAGREQAAKADQARRYALSTAISLAVLVLGIMGFLFDLGGGPA